jgi:hypothetical protein
MSTSGWNPYPFDAVGGAQSRWEDRVVHDGSGAPHLLCDTTAVVRCSDGEREVRIDRFTRQASTGVQNLDNPKHLVVSTETFEIPEGGVGAFRVDMAAEKLHADDVDYRDGFATFNVIDVEHKLIFDVVTTGSRIHGLYELQAEPVGVVAREDSFLYVIDQPELGVVSAAGSWHTYVVTIDTGRRTIAADVDGRPLFRTGDLPMVPRRIKLGMGILTLWPLDHSGRSTSLRGQGMVARWRDVGVRLSAAVSEGAEGRT